MFAVDDDLPPRKRRKKRPMKSMRLTKTAATRMSSLLLVLMYLALERLVIPSLSRLTLLLNSQMEIHDDNCLKMTFL